MVLIEAWKVLMMFLLRWMPILEGWITLLQKLLVTWKEKNCECQWVYWYQQKKKKKNLSRKLIWKESSVWTLQDRISKILQIVFILRSVPDTATCLLQKSRCYCRLSGFYSELKCNYTVVSGIRPNSTTSWRSSSCVCFALQRKM